MNFISRNAALLSCAALFGAGIIACTATHQPLPPDGGGNVDKGAGYGKDRAPGSGKDALITANRPVPRAIDPFMDKSIEWLVAAQQDCGGWGAGLHTAQNVRDPKAVKSDPATSAFAAMALLRAGHTPSEGKYRENVRKAVVHLVGLVEQYPEAGPKVTDLAGTQPQIKLGGLVDTGMTSQLLSRALKHLEADATLHDRTARALDKCLRKIESSQQTDGSWNTGGGWAPVLQTAMFTNALELGQVAGRPVSDAVVEKSRNYQRENYDSARGGFKAEAGAGVELYALASNTKANAKMAKDAQDVVHRAIATGALAPSAPVNEASLKAAGVSGEQAKAASDAVAQTDAAMNRLQDKDVMDGFGNNGGEEFLSYMQISESLASQGGEKWESWNVKMHEKLAKIQNADGSYSGHHCITSPVFCTAAVLLCLTADRETHIVEETSLVTSTSPEKK